MEFQLDKTISFWCSDSDPQLIHPDLQSHPPDLSVFLSHPLTGRRPQGQAGCSGSRTQAEERGCRQANPGKNVLDTNRNEHLLKMSIFSHSQYLQAYPAMQIVLVCSHICLLH